MHLLRTKYSLSILILIELTCFVASIFVTVYVLKKQNQANEQLNITTNLRHTSFLLADQLRQSSDDLTRMVRTYAATGDSKFEEYFYMILNIRDGKVPRPENYDRIFWDFKVAEKTIYSSEDGEKISLNTLMKNAGFSDEEFQLLEEAKRISDKLVKMEEIAINAMKGKFNDDKGIFTIIKEPDRELAIEILFSKEYHLAKKNIMKPIDDFLIAIDNRTSQTLSEAQKEIRSFSLVLVYLFCILVIFVSIFILTIFRYRRISEAELRKSKEYSQNLVDSSLDMIIAVDLKRRITEFNRSAEETFGYKSEEVLGKHINMLYENVEQGSKVHKTTVEKGRYTQEISNRRKNGEVFPAILAASTLVDKKGDIIGVMGVSRDITRRKKAADELQESEERFKDFFRNSAVGFHIFGSDKIITDMNNTELAMLGYDKEEIVGKKKWSDLIIPKQKPLFEEHWKQLLINREIRDFSYTVLHKDGHPIDVLLNASARFDKAGNLINTRGSVIDISTRKQSELEREKALDEAQKANEVKTQFLANMSHEIRTPLNSIMGFTKLIEQAFKKESGGKEQEFFETVQYSGKRLMNTVHEILDMAQIEAETLSVSLKKYDLADLVEKAVKPLIPEATAKGLKLKINTASSVFILADENCVTQSVVNLIENAIKYTDKGRIDIDLKEKTDTVELSIKDTGIGIGTEYQKHIFEVFTQESEGYTKKYQGVGLGMALTRKYLDLCDAAIEVKSKKNVGSTFTVTFKKMKERRGKERIEKPIEATTKIKIDTSQGKQHVLVVDDDESSQKLISFFLRDYYELEFAQSVMEAKEKLESKKIEMVLLDLSLLGDEDGLALARYMRKSKNWRKTPIIATTAHAFTEDRDKCLEAGCDDYLAKPIIREKLLEKMNQKFALAL